MFGDQDIFPKLEDYKRLNDGVARWKAEFEFICARAAREVGR